MPAKTLEDVARSALNIALDGSHSFAVGHVQPWQSKINIGKRYILSREKGLLLWGYNWGGGALQPALWVADAVVLSKSLSGAKSGSKSANECE